MEEKWYFLGKNRIYSLEITANIYKSLSEDVEMLSELLQIKPTNLQPYKTL